MKIALPHASFSLEYGLPKYLMTPNLTGWFTDGLCDTHHPEWAPWFWNCVRAVWRWAVGIECMVSYLQLLTFLFGYVNSHEHPKKQSPMHYNAFLHLIEKTKKPFDFAFCFGTHERAYDIWESPRAHGRQPGTWGRHMKREQHVQGSNLRQLNEK